MTTDVTNVQNSYDDNQNRGEISADAGFAIVMASVMGGPLALTFAVIVPVLVFGLFLIGKTAMPAFRAVFRKYDKLNESIEENVRGMRVVKGFAREDYESGKLKTASENIRVDFTKAERIVGLNGPLMEVCMYFNTAFVLYVGAKLVVSSRGTIIDIGQISAMLTYGVMVLMSLMMISMVYVMITMSVESMKRIVEVIDEETFDKQSGEPCYECQGRRHRVQQRRVQSTPTRL